MVKEKNNERLKREDVAIITVIGFLTEVGNVRHFELPIGKRIRSKLRVVLFNATIPLIAKSSGFRSLYEYYAKDAERTRTGKK